MLATPSACRDFVVVGVAVGRGRRMRRGPTAAAAFGSGRPQRERRCAVRKRHDGVAAKIGVFLMMRRVIVVIAVAAMPGQSHELGKPGNGIQGTGSSENRLHDDGLSRGDEGQQRGAVELKAASSAEARQGRRRQRERGDKRAASQHLTPLGGNCGAVKTTNDKCRGCGLGETARRLGCARTKTGPYAYERVWMRKEL